VTTLILSLGSFIVNSENSEVSSPSVFLLQAVIFGTDVCTWFVLKPV
jgi:hypothetical protein